MTNTGTHHISNAAASFWIEASAGTGKTKILVDRVINLLLAGSRPDRLLCLTFTKAAAAEMANRIRDRLSQWASLPTDILTIELRELMQQQEVDSKIPVARNLLNDVLRVPGGLQVQTIHGFCQYILKRFPLEANIQPHFGVMDEQKQTVLREQAFTLTMHEMDIGLLQALFEHVTLTRLQELVVQRPADKLSMYPFEVLDLDATITPETMLHHFAMDVPAVLKTQWIGLGWESYRDLFLTLKSTIRKKILPTSGIDGEILALEAQRVLQTDQRIKHWHMAGATLALKTFAQAFRQHYEHLKQAQAVLDYDDLIQKTATLLKNPDMGAWVLYKLDEGVDHILVDEAQDTNQAQWDIIYALSQEFFAGESARTTPRSLFVVGDSKQSIYSFQGADPAAFQLMRQQLQLHAQGAGLPFYITDLSVSYRSVPSVLKAVDQVFHTHMHEPSADIRNQFWLSNKKARRDARSVQEVHEHIESDGFCINRPKLVSYREHIPHRNKDGGIVEVWPLIAPPEKVMTEDWDLPTKTVVTTSPKRQLADKMARTIRGWFDTKEMLVSKGRPIEPRDIMILVRHRDELGLEIIRAFKKMGIPVAGIDRLKLNEHILVQDLLAIGQWCLLPEDDLLLATILKGPFFNYTEEEIFALCQGRGEQTLWHHLHTHGAPRLLGEWKALAYAVPPFEFFSTILSTGRDTCIARFGKEAEDVLNEFLNVCLRSEFSNLILFLQWLEKYPQEIKRDFEKVEDNVVRILTVHASKGLQAPIVFLPDTTQTPRDPSNFVYASDGQVLWVPRTGMRTTYIENLPTVSRDQQEYQRLLYVAMTRAEDRLYICGSTHKAVTSLEPDCWYQTVRESLRLIAETVPTENGDILRIQNVQERAIPLQVILPEVLSRHPLPAWYHHAVSAEYVAVAKPSGEGATVVPEEREPVTVFNDGLSPRERGILIHKLLEHLFTLSVDHRHARALAFLQSHKLPEDLQAEILQETLGLLGNPQMQKFFIPSSFEEVGVIGTIEGKLYKGYIDRLVIDQDRKHIYIVDFKSGYVPTVVPDQYQQQLMIYKQLVQPTYPDYTITGVLVWTKKGTIQVLNL